MVISLCITMAPLWISVCNLRCELLIFESVVAKERLLLRFAGVTNCRYTGSMKESMGDWERLDRLEDEDIDLSDIPEITPEMFARSVMRRDLKILNRRADYLNEEATDALDYQVPS